MHSIFYNIEINRDENRREKDREEEKRMSTLRTPFRYDYVGSFLRPARLKEARRAFDQGKTSYEELKMSALPSSLERLKRSAIM